MACVCVCVRNAFCSVVCIRMGGKCWFEKIVVCVQPLTENGYNIPFSIFINWTEVSGLFFMRVDCMCMNTYMDSIKHITITIHADQFQTQSKQLAELLFKFCCCLFFFFCGGKHTKTCSLLSQRYQFGTKCMCVAWACMRMRATWILMNATHTRIHILDSKSRPFPYWIGSFYVCCCCYCCFECLGDKREHTIQASQINEHE